MQQEHRIILTTLYCSFGSWAPAQVTAPCAANNPRGGSHPTRRPGPTSVSAPVDVGEAPATCTLAPVGARFVRSDAASTSPAGADLLRPKRVVPRCCRRHRALDPGPGPPPAACRPLVDDSQSVASGAAPCRRSNVVAGHDPHWEPTGRVEEGGPGEVRSSHMRWRRATRADPSTPSAGATRRIPSTPAGGPRVGAVFPGAPCCRAVRACRGATPESVSRRRVTAPGHVYQRHVTERDTRTASRVLIE
jgi:hypothetical protein